MNSLGKGVSAFIITFIHDDINIVISDIGNLLLQMKYLTYEMVIYRSNIAESLTGEGNLSMTYLKQTKGNWLVPCMGNPSMPQT